MSERNKICVVGAGVVGLTTATLLQETRPDVEVTVLAEKFLGDIVSDVAAGVFRPTANGIKGPDPETTLKWGITSRDYYEKYLAQPKCEEIGMRRLNGTAVTEQRGRSAENTVLRQLCREYRKLSATELKSIPNGDWQDGIHFETFVVECGLYLPYLMKKLEENGGRIIERRLESLRDLIGEFDAVINCCGLGAKALCGDGDMTPIKGQIIKVKAPWINEVFYADDDCYIIPGVRFVTLGGTREFGDWSKQPNRHNSNKIWEKCVRVMPSLRNAEIVCERSGLRPYRRTVRVETETLTNSQGKELKVVHNYGHGGYGVCYAPGTSTDAVRMLLQMLPRRSKL